MRKSKFNQTQIAKVLKESDNGKTVTDSTRQYGLGVTTLLRN